MVSIYDRPHHAYIVYHSAVLFRADHIDVPAVGDKRIAEGFPKSNMNASQTSPTFVF